MVCSFFGHKDTPSFVYPILVDVIRKLITDRGVTHFMVGNQGAFDSMVLKVLREVKALYPQICYNVVLAYVPGKNDKYEFYTPYETVLPGGIEAVPKRFAISWRNKWMLRESQIVVCYITHTWGGAAQFVEYAKRKNREIINLFNVSE